MAYKFQADESVREEIVRCAGEQLDRAIAELTEGINADPVKSVHNARKAIKKERSLLRLARGAMTSPQRRAENDALRSAARRLSATRDAEVMVASIDALAERFAGQLPATTFEAVGEQVRSRGVSTNAGPNGSVMGTAEELRAIRERVDDWELEADGWPAIESGLLRSYKRGKKAFASARVSRTPENLHAWRKRVKDLWYHERLLAPACGPTVDGQAKDAHRLADLLGDDHDLAILREELAGGLMPVPVDVDAVVKLLDHHRDELQDEALRVGDRVYSETPKAFARRMNRLWAAGRAMAEEPVEHHPTAVAAATREPQAA